MSMSATDSQNKPFVSVICPTTDNRKEFNNRVKEMFRFQDYPNKELLFSYDNLPIGAKRNQLCRQARGEIIIHMDSDDIYAPDWISKSVEFLQSSGADMVGLKDCYYYSPTHNMAWMFVYRMRKRGISILGATMCYWRRTWDKWKFPDMAIGEDTIWTTHVKDVKYHEYTDGFIATIHDSNTSSHNAIKFMKPVEPEIVENIINSHYKVG